MNALDLIKRAESEGVEMILAGDKVKLCARQRPSANLLTELRHHKPEIVRFLQKRDNGQQPSVWRARVDGKSMTIIDPCHQSLNEMEVNLENRFGPGRVQFFVKISKV